MSRERIIGEALGVAPGESISLTRVGGGDTAEAWRVERRTGARFVKFGGAQCLVRFEAEAHGLERLREADALRVPQVEAVGSNGRDAWLILEWLDLVPAAPATAAALGRGLAHMHRVSHAKFGLAQDNFIGASAQSNTRHDDWAVFFGQCRLGQQRTLAAAEPGFGSYSGALTRRLGALIDALPDLLGDHAPMPSLLHGDLWGGNWGALADGVPVVFDPAIYFGDREADLAMTELFGGFPADFYTAYNDVWPLPEGYRRRRDLYNLYHIVNHANLFGGGYGPRALRLVDDLLRDADRSK